VHVIYFWKEFDLLNSICQVYITSLDSHDWHDTAMILYVFLTAAWMFGVIFFTKDSSYQKTLKQRTIILRLFIFTFVPLGHYFIQHRVYQKQGAYSKYALFEWLLVIQDIYFDSLNVMEFQGLKIIVEGWKKAIDKSVEV
jgi:hypothetical protein